ncbi:hypothetical protein B0H11DRAFT_1727134 [Mycena galericulata]|nr:hypothetical protein B0H11DRAFT_1727134 [Mycena galericulata]
MPPPNAAPRKRTRKRKRRALSVSSSSSSSSSDSEAEVVQKAPTVPPVAAPESSDSSSSSSESDSDSDSSESDSESEKAAGPSSKKPAPAAAPPPRRNSPSPPPPSAELPTFLPPRDAPTHEDAEQAMKARFKKFWMASVADGFKDDLEEIRVKEPNLGASRLALLIDSLASGADVFTSTTQGDSEINEMEVVLE